MTSKERQTLCYMHDLRQGRRRQCDVAGKLHISTRHLRRKFRQWKEQGDRSLIDRRRVSSGRKGDLKKKQDFLSWYAGLPVGG